MCAINGITCKDQRLVEQMNACLAHRGPDGTGIFVDPIITLGHNRLSIIDLTSNASQPMVSASGETVISFNGEIYNFRELRELYCKKQSFKSASDTEVIVNLYEILGEKAFSLLNGIFAFALFDKKKKKLFLVRDSSGVKPLYYSCLGDDVIFSSEIKAILENKEVPRRLNHEATEFYFRLGFVSEEETLFKDIRKVKAGHYLEYDLAKKVFSIKKFAEFAIKKETGKKSAPELESLVRNAVTRQLVADVPVGVYLSGGIDSSIILDAVARTMTSPKTYTIRYALDKDEEPAKFNIDADVALRTSRHYGTDHHELVISSEDVLANFEAAISHADEPIAHPTSVPMFLLSKEAKKTVTVILTGDGGDELFGGYERYRTLRKILLYQKLIPENLRSILTKIHPALSKVKSGKPLDIFGLLWFSKSPLEKIVKSEFLDNKLIRSIYSPYLADKSDLHLIERFMIAEKNTWLIDFHLNLADKMAMAHGVENRVPFLDKEVIEFAERLPLSQKVSFFDRKILLKRAFRHSLPEELFHLPKRGWISPGAKWLRHPRFIGFAKEILSPSYHSSTADLFYWPEIERILRSHIEKKEYNLNLIWQLLTFQVWAKSFHITL
ncbi:MAG: asparagine synthase (glutamine-hydrolyzing) [Candidatus Harrisonbacteria bacterium]|nr:asparagine synthase (glutamine-hydrolyzing) [Candidatus Harrisonbacteria bacterium]